MNTRYVGLCLGGPKDGQTVEYSTPYFSASYPRHIDWDRMFTNAPRDLSETTTITRYHHFVFPIRRNPDRELEGIHFWLSEDVKPDEIFDRLMDGYRRSIVIERC